MERLEEGIRKCNLCNYVDKPFLKQSVYSWLPEKVRVLAIGESPPPGRKEGSLYNLQRFDRLRLSLSLILKVEPREVLQFLRRSGVFFTASVKCRPPTRKSLPEMRKNCVPRLIEEIEVLRPQKIVAMGRFASTSIGEIYKIPVPRELTKISSARCRDLEIFFTPHPNYVFRFARELSSKIAKILLE
jgi:uracil-DNA glycosylase